MINGLILYKEGDSTGSRLLLTKALKQAHGMVGSGQFVGQILNALAPVQKQRNDHAGALQMFESATTLLKSVKDLMSLVTTLIGMQKLYQEMNQPGEFFYQSLFRCTEGCICHACKFDTCSLTMDCVDLQKKPQPVKSIWRKKRTIWMQD